MAAMAGKAASSTVPGAGKSKTGGRVNLEDGADAPDQSRGWRCARGRQTAKATADAVIRDAADLIHGLEA